MILEKRRSLNFNSRLPSLENDAELLFFPGLNAHPHSAEKTRRHKQHGTTSPTHHSSQSTVNSRGVRTPPGVGEGVNPQTTPSAQHIPSPYGVNARANDFLHDPSEFANPVDTDRKYRRNKDRNRNKGRGHTGSRGSKSPSSPTRTGSVVSGMGTANATMGHGGSERSRSPGALSGGSGSMSLSSSRNPSFRTAVTNPAHKRPPLPPPTTETKNATSGGVPLAAEEDLSPLSPPETPTRGGFAPRLTPSSGEMIPMGDYDRNNRNRFRDSGIADTHIGSPDGHPKQPLGGGRVPPSTEPRPPVEGRDSLRRQVSPPYTTHNTNITTPDRQNGNFIPSGGGGDQRPGLKPLPLRNIQRPDGQSPEHQSTDPGDANANPPTSGAGAGTESPGGDLSPILRKTQLFTDTSDSHPGTPGSMDALQVEDGDGFEYDDYMPSLPGSYFTMDPGAYTLTWSAQPPWSRSGGAGGGVAGPTGEGLGHAQSAAQRKPPPATSTEKTRHESNA